MEDLIIDADSALRDVSTFRLELTEFDGIRGMLGEVEEHDRQFAEDLGEFSIRVEQLLERLERTLKEIEARQTSGSASAAAFYLSTLSNEFSAQIEWLQRTLEGIKRRIRGPVSSEGALYSLKRSVSKSLAPVKSYLVPLLKKFLSKIWQIISNLLTPKEWKLSGEVGTGILGLTKVGIEITFGPPDSPAGDGSDTHP